MALDRTNFEHICNVVKRQIQEEVKGLNLCFIVHENGGRRRALAQKKEEILACNGGRLALSWLRRHQNHNKSRFMGLLTGSNKTLLPSLKSRKTLALFFLNAEEYRKPDDAQEHVYHLVWHALHLLACLRNEDSSQYRTKENLVISRENRLILSKKNLMADVFTAAMMELRHDMPIVKLAEKRAAATLKAEKNHNPSLFPFPLAFDSTELIVGEIQLTGTGKGNITEQCLRIAGEIGTTYDNVSIQQWWAFSSAAQEMAWTGADSKTILGTSVHTSEDPYVRAIAYLVAEVTGIQPRAITELNNYNPFAENEYNERLHKRKCEETARIAINKAVSSGDTFGLYAEAYQQNLNLLQNKPLGWCAHALLRTAGFIRTREAGEKKLQQALSVFNEHNQETNWENVREANRHIMKMRLADKIPTFRNFSAAADGNPSLKLVARSFSDLLASEYFDELSRLEKGTAGILKTKRKGIREYTQDSYAVRANMENIEMRVPQDREETGSQTIY